MLKCISTLTDTFHQNDGLFSYQNTSISTGLNRAPLAELDASNDNFIRVRAITLSYTARSPILFMIGRQLHGGTFCNIEGPSSK